MCIPIDRSRLFRVGSNHRDLRQAADHGGDVDVTILACVLLVFFGYRVFGSRRSIHLPLIGRVGFHLIGHVVDPFLVAAKAFANAASGIDQYHHSGSRFIWVTWYLDDLGQYPNHRENIPA